MFRPVLVVLLLLPLVAAEPGHRFDGDESLCAPDTIISNCDTADGSVDEPYIIDGFAPTEAVESCADPDPFTGEPTAFLAVCGVSKTIHVQDLHIDTSIPAAGLAWLGGGDLVVWQPAIKTLGTAMVIKGDGTGTVLVQGGDMVVDADIGYTRSAAVFQDVDVVLDGLSLSAANMAAGLQFPPSSNASVTMRNVHAEVQRGGNVVSFFGGWTADIESSHMTLDGLRYPGVEATLESAAINAAQAFIAVRNTTIEANTFGIRLGTEGGLVAQGNQITTPEGVALHLGSTALTTVHGVCGLTFSHNDIDGPIHNQIGTCEAPLQSNHWIGGAAAHVGLVNTSQALAVSSQEAPWMSARTTQPGFADQRGALVVGTSDRPARIQVLDGGWIDLAGSVGAWSTYLPAHAEGSAEMRLRACIDICGPIVSVTSHSGPAAQAPVVVFEHGRLIDASPSYSPAGLEIVSYAFDGPIHQQGQEPVVPALAGEWTVRVQDELGQWSAPAQLVIQDATPIADQKTPFPFPLLLLALLAWRRR